MMSFSSRGGAVGPLSSKQTVNLDDDFFQINRIMEGIFDLRNPNKDQNVESEALCEQKNIDLYIRDSLIKSFMIIFTNEKSKHLLLNYDLIDIAFNCMQSS